MPYTTQKAHKKLMGQTLVAGKCFRGKRTRREALPEGDKIEWYRLSHPGQESSSVSVDKAHIPQELRGTRRGPYWVEYRPGGTGDHPGVDIKCRVPSNVSD